MANELRTRQNFLGGLTENNPLLVDDLTLISGSLLAMQAVGSTQYMPLVLDPKGVNGLPEIVWVTAHVVGGSNATILRGQEGTTARQHPVGTRWVHAPTTLDFSSGPAGDTAWKTVGTDIAYASGSNYPAPYGPVRFRKDANGFVHFRGLSQFISQSVVCFTMPVGYRPSEVFMSWVMGNNYTYPARVDIQPSGTVQLNESPSYGSTWQNWGSMSPYLAEG